MSQNFYFPATFSTSTNPATGPTGSAAPAQATEAGGVDGSGVLRALSTNSSGVLNANIVSSLVPTAYDYVALTYVPSGNGVGQVQTAVYKTGGASGTTVATLTLAYDASNNLSSVTKS